MCIRDRIKSCNTKICSCAHLLKTRSNRSRKAFGNFQRKLIWDILIFIYNLHTLVGYRCPKRIISTISCSYRKSHSGRCYNEPRPSSLLRLQSTVSFQMKEQIPGTRCVLNLIFIWNDRAFQEIFCLNVLNTWCINCHTLKKKIVFRV